MNTPSSGSGISPFIPTSTPTSTFYVLIKSVVFLFRLPFFLSYCFVYFLFLAYIPLPLAVRKLLLWAMLGIPGVWWVDLQLDGVKRGSLSQQPKSRVPHPGSIIAAQFTSPVDALSLAAIFDPVFTISYPAPGRSSASPCSAPSPSPSRPRHLSLPQAPSSPPSAP